MQHGPLLDGGSGNGPIITLMAHPLGRTALTPRLLCCWCRGRAALNCGEKHVTRFYLCWGEACGEAHVSQGSEGLLCLPHRPFPSGPLVWSVEERPEGVGNQLFTGKWIADGGTVLGTIGKRVYPGHTENVITIL